MAYVRSVVTASGARAVQVVEKKHGRLRVLEHVGSAHSDEELAVLKSTARARLHEGQQELGLGIDDQVRVEDEFSTRGMQQEVSLDE